MVGIPEIVLIKQGDQIRLGMRHPKVARRGLAAVLLAQQPDQAVGNELFDDGGTVVHDNNILGRPRLFKNAIDRIQNKLASVIKRNDRGDRQVCCHAASFSRPTERTLIRTVN